MVMKIVHLVDCLVRALPLTAHCLPHLSRFAIPTDDCHAGSTAFVALGGYTYFSGMQSLRERRKAIAMSKSRYKYGSRQLGILSLSATLVGLGIYRMFN